MHVKKMLVTGVVAVMSLLGAVQIAHIALTGGIGWGEHVARLHHGSTRQDALDASMTGHTNLSTLDIQPHR